MSFDSALATFLTEATELLERMEMSLVELARSGSSAELINDIFRAAHTIKGTGGVFGFDTVVEFTHVVENLLDRIRAGHQEITPDMASLLLECCDHMRLLVQAAVEDTALNASEQGTHQQLLAQLQDCMEQPADQSLATTAEQDDDARVTRQPDPDDPRVENDHWHISIRFSPAVLQYGMDPLSFLRYLNRLGQVVDVVTLFDDKVTLAELNPELCHLGLEIAFQGDVTKQELEEVFEFVQDDCTLHILPPEAQISEYVRLIAALPEEDLKLGEILTRVGALTPSELEQALQWQDSARQSLQEPGETPRLGEVLVQSRDVHEAVVQAAATKQETVRKNLSAGQKSLRVDAEKLDQLVNLIGELVIATASSRLQADKSGDPDLKESLSVMERLVEGIRDSALSLRMVQIGETFNRFQRVVLDVGRELGKDVRLEISGGEAELDKTLVERIRDPLMHLVRNGIDHGLEDIQTRLEQGKPAQGTIRLNAYHDSGSIIIEVSDDGRGLQRDSIRKKAMERGLIREQDELSDREIYRLIFEPGFSTADKITNLSGRGVGMDVVKREVEALRGNIDIDSAPGRGTRISIRLPLTLAIINGFLFRVGQAQYVVPLEMVGECIESPRLNQTDEAYMELRGHVLPLLRLSHLFQQEASVSQRENIIVIESAGYQVGLVVNELLGEFQTVIKPLGQIFANLKGIAGSTILGSGEVALVLDPHELIQNHVSHQRLREEREAALQPARREH